MRGSDAPVRESEKGENNPQPAVARLGSESGARVSEETDGRTIRGSVKVGRTRSAEARECEIEDNTRGSEGSSATVHNPRERERAMKRSVQEEQRAETAEEANLGTVSTGGRAHTGICAAREAGITLSTSGSARGRDKLR